MTVLLASIVAAGIALPHLLRLERAAPATAATLWLVSLALRALTGLLVVVYLIRFVPHTDSFAALTHWCWHTVGRLLPLDGGLEGRHVGDAAAALPALALVASVASVAVGVARAARSVRRLLARGSLGPGPDDSVIIGGPDVMLAAAGLRHPRVVVSAGALTALDDAELAAGLEHERAHIVRRHRHIVLLAQGCRSLGRFVPGGRRACRELAFHLERDADRWVIERRHDRSALASAICKATTGAHPPGVTPLAGPGIEERLGQLLDGRSSMSRRGAGIALNGLAVVMVACTLVVASLVPAVSLASVHEETPAGHQHHTGHCDHDHARPSAAH